MLDIMAGSTHKSFNIVGNYGTGKSHFIAFVAAILEHPDFRSLIKEAEMSKIRETFDNYLILREALLIGFGLNHSRNNFHLTYESLSAGKPVGLFSDQFRSPLSLEDAAAMISQLAGKDIKGETLNFGGRERLSRYQLGEIICEESGFDKILLRKVTMEEAGLTYKVADVSLNTEKLISCGVEPKPIRDSIRKLLSERI